jgi:hypothetical protein
MNGVRVMVNRGFVAGGVSDGAKPGVLIAVAETAGKGEGVTGGPG